MNIETNKFKIITPAEGMWLCNRKAKTFSQEVYMAADANHSQWEEIKEEEKIRLETEWENEIETTEEEYATAGKILLGVE